MILFVAASIAVSVPYLCAPMIGGETPPEVYVLPFTKSEWPWMPALGDTHDAAYSAFVCGSNDIGAKSTPPPFFGANSFGKSVPYESKIQAEIQLGSCSAHCGISESPTGNGCVAAFAWLSTCWTGFSSMPASGLPLVRSSI